MDKQISLLFIGNSFSDDTIEYMDFIAKDLGINLLVKNMFIGGCSLERHISNIHSKERAYECVYRINDQMVRIYNSELVEVIKERNWDYISLQQCSPLSGVKETYEQIKILKDLVKQNVTNLDSVKFIWNMTWAYELRDTTPDAFLKVYNNDQKLMYKRIVDAVKEYVVTDKDFVTFIPSGTAVQNARTSYIGNNLTRDGFHMSLDLGRYIVGINAIKTIFNINLNKLNYKPDGVDERMKKMAIECVLNAHVSPFEVTESKYK